MVQVNGFLSHTWGLGLSSQILTLAPVIEGICRVNQRMEALFVYASLISNTNFLEQIGRWGGPKSCRTFFDGVSFMWLFFFRTGPKSSSCVETHSRMYWKNSKRGSVLLNKKRNRCESQKWGKPLFFSQSVCLNLLAIVIMWWTHKIH